MPIYEYKCDRCSHLFELRQSFKDDSATCCPVCGSDAQRIFSPVPVIFKGSGFYVTDHRSGPSKESDSTETKPGKS